MRAIFPALLILTPALLQAAENPPAEPRKKLPAISLLPDGSELKGVILPRYDENHHLVGVLKARAMTLVNAEKIAGETVAIEFFNPDQSPRGRVDLVKAEFDQVRGLLEAAEPVTLRSDRLSAKGSGLVYAFQQGEGFLLGPATTWIQPATQTTMNSSHSPLRATAVAGLSLLSQALAATPPPSVSPEEKTALHAGAVSAATVHDDAARVARMDLKANLDASAAATAKAKAFLDHAELTNHNPDTPAPQPKPLDLKPGPDDTVITCDGGMYFDADEGMFVYLNNVKVNDPRFTLTGAKELKVFLGKKPADATKKPAKNPAPDKNDPTGTGLGSKFNDVERVVATGAVRVLQKQPEAGKPPIEASGAILSYEPKTGQILINGGYPWVKQGTTFMRAKEPDLILRINKSGSFVTEGNWEMGGNLNQH